MSERRAIELALTQRAGMQKGDLAKLDAFNEQATDWYATCPKCKHELRGTLAEIKAHSCDDH